MHPKEFDCMSYYDLGVKMAGFKDRQSHELDIIRQHALLCYVAPHLDPKKLKNLTIDKVWPVAKNGKKADNKKVPDDKRARIAAGLHNLKGNAKIRTDI